jgi:hypothetical protein
VYCERGLCFPQGTQFSFHSYRFSFAVFLVFHYTLKGDIFRSKATSTYLVNPAFGIDKSEQFITRMQQEMDWMLTFIL